MKPTILYQALFAAALVSLPLAATAQTSQTAPAPAASSSSPTATPSSPGTQSGGTTSDTAKPMKQEHHASARAHTTRHHDMAKHHDMHMASSSEHSYKMALKQCVSGPADAKESCLDQAIRNHRS